MVSGDERCDDDKGEDQTHIHFEVATGLRFKIRLQSSFSVNLL